MSRSRPGFGRSSLSLLLLLTLSCSSAKTDRTPEQVFDRMEQELMKQPRVGFSVESTGAFEASFDGWIRHEAGELAMAAEGTWAGEPVAVSAETSRDYLVVNTPKKIERLEREPFVATAVFVGLSRMGVLHNLARLVAGLGPDHSDGTVRDWVEARNITFGSDGQDTIQFDIFVKGKQSASAIIRVDPVTGLPLEREQTVDFGSGTMTVTETYRY